MTTLPKALIFDCDGTLVLTADLHYAAFCAAFAAQGSTLDRDFYLARGGLARHALIADWMATTGTALDSARLVRDSIHSAEALAQAGRCRANPPIEALARAWGARPSAVASNGEGPVVRATLHACGLETMFDTVVTLDQVAEPKPAPDMFLLAAARLATPPADCLVLEDSAQGLEAARRAGIRALDVREPQALADIEAMMLRLAPATAR